MSKKNNLLGLTREELQDYLIKINEKPYRGLQIFEWIHNKGIIDFDSMTNLGKDLIEKLKQNNSINVIGDPKERGSVICFTMKGIHPHDIATILDEDGVAIRAGHHCCQILHDKLGIPATARASLGVYNSKEDIDILSDAINNCKKIFKV